MWRAELLGRGEAYNVSAQTYAHIGAIRSKWALSLLVRPMTKTTFRLTKS